MFSEAEKKIQLERAGRFFLRLPEHFFAELRTFSAEIAVIGKAHSPWSARLELPRRPIGEQESWGTL